MILRHAMGVDVSQNLDRKEMKGRREGACAV